jgi:arylformamidase
MLSAEGWIDISIPLKSDMLHYPGDPRVEINRIKEIAGGDPYTITHLSMGAHSGTHVDAPSHCMRDGTSIDRIPMTAILGRAKILEINHGNRIAPGDIDESAISPGDIILLKTSNSELLKQKAFTPEYVYLSTEAAEYLADRNIATIGIDYLSIGGQKNDDEVHRILLQASIWIIEGLDLSGVSAGVYDFVCLPLRIEGAEAAPARAFLKPVL